MKRIFFTASLILSVIIAGSLWAADDLMQQQKQFTPKKVEVDTNYDGKVDRAEYYDDKGQIMKVEDDTTGMGRINEWIYYKNGVPVKKEKDTNGDGKPDVFVSY